MELRNRRRSFVVVGVCAALLVAAVAGLAGQGNKATLEEVLAKVADVLARVQSVEQKVDVITIQASVWEEACIGGSVQCTTSHNINPASSANHNPVAIRFLVLRNGQTVLGLTAADVDLRSGSFLAVGPGIVRCDDGNTCAPESDANFQDVGNGLYVLWVHPYVPNSPNWKPGSYMMTLTVTDADGKTGHGIAEIEIES
jgi:hypothetical protein